MIYISHRGNVDGRNIDAENSPPYILETIKMGYTVEADVWFVAGEWLLGHDYPRHSISKYFLMSQDILCHAKNPGALCMLSQEIPETVHFFWHQEDKYTITNRGYIISYPGLASVGDKTIIMKPEQGNHNIDGCYAICSDYIGIYKNEEQDKKLY